MIYPEEDLMIEPSEMDWHLARRSADLDDSAEPEAKDIRELTAGDWFAARGTIYEVTGDVTTFPTLKVTTVTVRNSLLDECPIDFALNPDGHRQVPAWRFAEDRHDCQDFAVETSPGPSVLGGLIVTTICERCGRGLDRVTDSIL